MERCDRDREHSVSLFVVSLKLRARGHLKGFVLPSVMRVSLATLGKIICECTGRSLVLAPFSFYLPATEQALTFLDRV